MQTFARLILGTLAAFAMRPALASEHCALCSSPPPEVARAIARIQQEQPKPKPTKEEKDKARHDKELADDAAMGKKYADEALKELKLSKDINAAERVSRIGAELAKIANQHIVDVSWGDKRLNPFDFQFYYVEGKEVNAFSLPGGHIFVYEGLVNFAESDDELAGVLAHEIAHASFRHIATLQRERSKLEAITLPLILISLLAGGESGMAGASAGQLVNQAMGSGWSVKAEKAADSGGLQYMRKSRYNPTGILTFMERLAYRDRSQSQFDWGIYRTHPPSRDRANNLNDQLKKANIPVERSLVTKTLATTVTIKEDKSVELKFGNFEIATLGGPDAEARGREFARRLNRFMDRVPRLSDVRSKGLEIRTIDQQVLMILTEEDALAAKVSLEVASDNALKGLRAAVYDLNYRVWDAY